MSAEPVLRRRRKLTLADVSPRQLPAPAWAYPPGADDDVIREEDRAVDGSLDGWFPLELRWRTRRWWPTEDGWWLLLLPCFVVLVSVWGLASHPESGRIVEYALFDATAVGICVGLILFVPMLHEPETATWTLNVSLDSVRFEKETPGWGREMREISRPEAGELVVDARRERGFRGGTFPMLHSAAGRSVDGLTEIVLPNRSISSGGFLGHFSRVSVDEVLISWWPVNRRSRAGLRTYERVGFCYWHPSGYSGHQSVGGADDWR